VNDLLKIREDLTVDVEQLNGQIETAAERISMLETEKKEVNSARLASEKEAHHLKEQLSELRVAQQRETRRRARVDQVGALHLVSPSLSLPSTTTSLVRRFFFVLFPLFNCNTHVFTPRLCTDARRRRWSRSKR
jgi:hypothetical protein